MKRILFIIVAVVSTAILTSSANMKAKKEDKSIEGLWESFRKAEKFDQVKQDVRISTARIRADSVRMLSQSSANNPDNRPKLVWSIEVRIIGTVGINSASIFFTHCFFS